MRTPDDAEISPRKLTDYLMRPRLSDDKSKFLAQAGFTPDNPDDLPGSLRRLAIQGEAEEDDENEYGTFYRLDGPLVAPGDQALVVATVWFRRHGDGSFHFVTLKPLRSPRS